MPDEEWRGLDDTALEQMLVERWVHRGLMLGIVLLAAIATTYLGVRGVSTFTERLAVGAALLVGLATGAGAFAMRQQDLRMHRELRRRRQP